MKNHLVMLSFVYVIFVAACRPSSPIPVKTLLATPTAVSHTPAANFVEVTRVVGTAEPTATPAPCTPLLEGMRLTVSMAKEARTILLGTEGLLPEDRLIILLSGQSPNHSSEIELTLANPVGPDGRYQDTFHLGESDIVNWSGQIIHQRGARCFEFTLPLTEPIVLEALPTPTATPVPTAVPNTNDLLTTAQNGLPAVNRIQFAPGATAARLTDQLDPQGVDVYVLAAQAGQQMSVMLTVPDDAARITVQDSSGDYLYGQVTSSLWQGDLSETGDYVIRVYGGETAVDYTLQVIIPQRINFDPGAISATIEGDVAAHVSDDYILAAQAGQIMTVNIISPNNNVLLTIFGADGIPLTNGLMSGATSWQGELLATQDYTLRAIGTLESASYTLTVTIE